MTTATRTAAPCLRCDGTPGSWIATDGTRHTCYGCNGTGQVLLTAAGLKARTTRKAPKAVAAPTYFNCMQCFDTGDWHDSNGTRSDIACRHCNIHP